MNTTYNCPQCGQPMDAYEQPSLTRSSRPKRYETCRTPECRIEGVTLQAGFHSFLTERQVRRYEAARKGKVQP